MRRYVLLPWGAEVRQVPSSGLVEYYNDGQCFKRHWSTFDSCSANNAEEAFVDLVYARALRETLKAIKMLFRTHRWRR